MIEVDVDLFLISIIPVHYSGWKLRSPQIFCILPKTGFLLIPKRREPPIEIFMGRTEVVYFADGFGNLEKKSSRIFVAMLQDDFAGEGVDDIGDKGQV